MTRTTPPQVAMSSGEIDPLLHRRFDYQRYQTGLAACRGFLPMVQGGITRAPGTIYRGQAAGASVLIPFVFAANDAVVLEFSANVMRVWRYGQLVTVAGVPYTLATPYGAPSLARLRWVQSADVIYLCDGLQPVQRLARLALDSWTIAPHAIQNGPFRVQNVATGQLLQASDNLGTITLTCNSPFFSAGHVGSLIQLKPTDETAVPLWIADQPITVNEKRRYGGNTYQLVQDTSIGDPTKNTGINPPVHTEGDETYSPGRVWRYLGDGVGVVRITAVASTTSATATVLRRVPDGCVAAATYRWAEGAWSDRFGWPSQIEIYDQRLVLASTPTEPRTVWFSGVGDYADFLPGTEADESFAYTIAGQGSINAVQNLCRGRSGLHILALGEEYSTRAESRAQVIGATTAVFSLDGSIGSAPARPIAPAGDPIFISRDRRRVMQIAYSMEIDGNQAANLTRAAQHLGADLFEQIVWQATPEPIGWLRRATGDLVAMLMDKAEDVLGWAVLPVAGGFVEAMAATPSADGTQDVLTLVVRRTVAGTERRFVEELALPFPALGPSATASRAVHFFASSIFAPSSPQAAFTVAHLAGAVVHAWTDQGAFGPLTVANDGTVTLPVAVSRACIGLLDNTHRAETLDIVAQAPAGSSMGRGKRLTGKIGLGLHATAQGFVQVVEREFPANARIGEARRLIDAPAGQPFAAALSGITQVAATTGHAKEIALRFTPYSGAPLTITAIIPDIQEAG